MFWVCSINTDSRPATFDANYLLPSAFPKKDTRQFAETSSTSPFVFSNLGPLTEKKVSPVTCCASKAATALASAAPFSAFPAAEARRPREDYIICRGERFVPTTAFRRGGPP